MSDSGKSQRKHPRQKLFCNLSEHLITADTRQLIRCLAIDVSRNGLGLVSFQALTPESEVILVLKERGVTLKVIWCKADSVRQGIFHIGLGTNDPSINIIGLLKDEGLMQENIIDAGTVPDSPSKVEKACEITFDLLRDAISKVHMADNGLFRAGNLASLARAYNAYPIKFNGISLFVLLPRDIRPSEASKLDEVTAAERKIVVLIQDGGNLTKVWPNITPGAS